MNIKEASDLTGVSADTIRYYERIGLIMPIERVNGIRKFGERNINQINFARQMRDAGLGIEILKDYVTLVFEGDTSTIPARKEMLAEAIEALNSKKDDISKAADYLQWKIDNYDTHMTPTEENLK
ncbi:MerR family transcriptional regulator [Listeria monocytogenes]|uniref:MerR family transcriptional regulator n=2 Tax=Listeria monocytogenes TaxID=1639 RepID=A0A823FL94_LISMN|nr:MULTISPECIES: MerR family transcriptional regulator [Bacilli]EAE3706364.1 MerR family transcriptional regulator [Listeria monocytogenes serotype 1/2b]ANE39600.1 MerR family transcriptional regulator [Listeria monocytogenes]AQP80011.1 MerR family transcriptional regulator [Listeria monocytogenes]EAC2470317.1 MerR family transcriptional regulator [Listeria monocytogenes]EAC2470527.1 MerR family transcriptional regulator [Listeria monocytogenes]